MRENIRVPNPFLKFSVLLRCFAFAAYLPNMHCAPSPKCRQGDLSCDPLLLLGSLRILTPKYAYITSSSTQQINSYAADLLGRLAPTGSITQATSPFWPIPDKNGRFLHFQTTGPATIHWRSVDGSGIAAATGGSLLTTSSAILERSVIYPNLVIGLVQGGGSSLQAYSLQADGPVALILAAQEAGTNYASMAQHPSLGLVYTLDNGTTLRVSSLSSNGIFAFRASTAANGTSIAMDPGGRFLITANANASNNLSYYSLDSQGLPTLVQTITAGGAFAANLALDPSGRILYVGRQTASNNLLTVLISPFQVVATDTIGHTSGSLLQSLVVEPGGRALYSAGVLPPTVLIFQLPLGGGTPGTLLQTITLAGPPAIGLFTPVRCVVVPLPDC